MNVHYKCIPCTINSYLRLVDTGIIPDDLEKVILRRLLRELALVDYDQSPPVLGQRMHRLIRELLQNTDPYHEIKEKYNNMMLELYPRFEGLINRSEDPFDTSMRLAIAGNVIDFGSQYQLDVMDTINRILDARLAIDDSSHLRDDLKQATSLLYIGDNCGEIVLDKLFLSFINVPEMYFAVRDRPIINDVTFEDANLVGIDRVAKVISTGDDAPGVVWNSASEEFKDIFMNADVIISKGQGNLEGLMDIPCDNIYFLLVTKCELIAEQIGTKKGEFIVKKGTEYEKSNPS